MTTDVEALAEALTNHVHSFDGGTATPEEYAAALLAALPEGWHLTNDGAVTALRAALDDLANDSCYEDDRARARKVLANTAEAARNYEDVTPWREWAEAVTAAGTLTDAHREMARALLERK